MPNKLWDGYGIMDFCLANEKLIAGFNFLIGTASCNRKIIAPFFLLGYISICIWDPFIRRQQ